MQENALYTITNGLYVLSVQDGEGYAGSLVDAVSQIAVSPYLIMVSCMNNSHTKSCIEKAGEFGISVLAKEPIRLSWQISAIRAAATSKSGRTYPLRKSMACRIFRMLWPKSGYGLSTN